MTSTLTGWMPVVGDVVWAQWYSPQRPHVDATIQERIAAGVTYGERRRMIVTRVVPGGNGSDLTRWYMRPLGRDLGPAFWSGAESDWCVLEAADEPVVDVPEPVKKPRLAGLSRPAEAPGAMTPLFDLNDTGMVP